MEQGDVDLVDAFGRGPHRRRLRPGREDKRPELSLGPGPGWPSPAGGAAPPGGAAHRTKIPSLVATLVRLARGGLRRSRRCAPGRDDGPPPRLAIPRSRAVPVRGSGRLFMTRLRGHGQMSREPRSLGNGLDSWAPSAARGSSYTRCTEATTASYDNRLARGPLRRQSVHPCDELAGQSLIAAVKPGLRPR